MATKKVGTTGRFGPHYGLSIRKKVKEVEDKQKKRQICIKCNMPCAKRVSTGIFLCKKCGTKFTGKAYFVE